MYQLIITTMKTLNLELAKDILIEFSLSTEEMINVRGGEGDPICIPTQPPIKI